MQTRTLSLFVAVATLPLLAGRLRSRQRRLLRQRRGQRPERVGSRDERDDQRQRGPPGPAVLGTSSTLDAAVGADALTDFTNEYQALNASYSLTFTTDVSATNLGTCQTPGVPSTMDDSLQARVALIEPQGGYPAEGFAFDPNGFAGARGPRFGPDSSCPAPQEAPVTYPFASYAGDVLFTPPQVGDRVLDFDTEGLVHIGLLPEMIEGARRDGVSDADLEPLFRSAEGDLPIWEKAERRSRTLRQSSR